MTQIPQMIGDVISKTPQKGKQTPLLRIANPAKRQVCPTRPEPTVTVRSGIENRWPKGKAKVKGVWVLSPNFFFKYS